MPVAAEEFRAALRQWASGVTVVTSRVGDVVHGMTVSSFASVSLDPPLVLVCANRGSRTNDVIARGGKFTVNILASDQQDVSNTFASSKTEGSRFDSVPWHDGATGVPVIEGALANLECTVVGSHQEGSHRFTQRAEGEGEHERLEEEEDHDQPGLGSAQGPGGHSRRHRNGGSAAAAARGEFCVPRIPGDAGQGTVGHPLPAEFCGRGFAYQYRTLLTQARHARRVHGRGGLSGGDL